MVAVENAVFEGLFGAIQFFHWFSTLIGNGIFEICLDDIVLAFALANVAGFKALKLVLKSGDLKAVLNI